MALKRSAVAADSVRSVDLEKWLAYEREVEAIIRAFTEWGGPDLANEMSPEAENLRALLDARPDRGVNYLKLPRPTL